MAICWPTENAATSGLWAKIVSSSACCTPAPPGVNGNTDATTWTPRTSNALRTEPPMWNASSSAQ